MSKRYSRPRYFSDVLKEHLKNPRFRKAYEEEGVKAEIAIQVVLHRQKAGLTQKQLATKVGVSQQVIARIENPGKSNMTLSTLGKVASALGKQLDIHFK